VDVDKPPPLKGAASAMTGTMPLCVPGLAAVVAEADAAPNSLGALAASKGEGAVDEEENGLLPNDVDAPFSNEKEGLGGVVTFLTELPPNTLGALAATGGAGALPVAAVVAEAEAAPNTLGALAATEGAAALFVAA
jgi:hypothetical protein